MIISKRVQDRVRIIGRTNVREMEDSKAVNVKLEGKIVTVFLLLIVGIWGTLLSFFVEWGHYRYFYTTKLLQHK